MVEVTARARMVLDRSLFGAETVAPALGEHCGTTSIERDLLPHSMSSQHPVRPRCATDGVHRLEIGRHLIPGSFDSVPRGEGLGGMLLGPYLSYGNAQAQRNPRRLGHQGESGQRDLHCPGSVTVPPRGPELLPIRLCAGARHGRANRIDLDVPMRQSGLALNLVPCRNGSLNFVPIRRLADEPPNGRLRV
jgi:hypothetical protein